MEWVAGIVLGLPILALTLSIVTWASQARMEKCMSAEFDALKSVINDAKAALTALEAKVGPADPAPADIVAVTTDLKAAVDQANAKLAG